MPLQRRGTGSVRFFDLEQRFVRVRRAVRQRIFLRLKQKSAVRRQRGERVNILVILGIVVAWILLQAYILPKMGVST